MHSRCACMTVKVGDAWPPHGLLHGLMLAVTCGLLAYTCQALPSESSSCASLC